MKGFFGIGRKKDKDKENQEIQVLQDRLDGWLVEQGEDVSKTVEDENLSIKGLSEEDLEELEREYKDQLRQINHEIQTKGFNYNTYEEEDLHDDLQILDYYIEYNSEEQAEFLMFNIRIKEDYEDEWTEMWKCVKLLRLKGFPRTLREENMLLSIWDDVLIGLHDQDVNFITLMANVLKPERIGLLYCYGVQSVAETPEKAKHNANIAYAGLAQALMGNFSQVEFRLLTRQEASWVDRQMREMKHLLMLRGIPKPRRSAGQSTTLSIGGTEGTPNSEEQNEEFLRGMSDTEYLLLLLTSPVGFSDLQRWLRITSDQLSIYKSEMAGTRGISTGISIPIMFMGNLGSAFGKSFGESNSFGHSFGISESDSSSLSLSNGLSESISSSHSEGISESLSMSQGNTHSLSFSESQGLNYSEGVSFTEGNSSTNSISFGESISHGESSSFSQTFGESVTSSHSFGFSESESVGVSQSIGTSEGVSESHGVSEGTSIGTSVGQSSSNGSSSGSSIGGSWNQGSSDGTSSSTGQSNSSSQGTSSSNSESTSTGTSSSHSTSFGQSYSSGISNSFGTSNSEGSSSNIGTGQSSGTSLSHGSSESYGTSQSWGESLSHSASWGETHSVTNSTSTSSGGSWSQSSSIGTSSGSSTGSSISEGFSHSLSTGESFGQSMSSGVSFGSSESVSHGTSESNSISGSISYGHSSSNSINISGDIVIAQGGFSIGGGISGGASASTGHSVGETNGVSAGISQGISGSLGETYGQSFSEGTGHSTGISFNAGTSNSVSQSEGISTGGNWSQGTSTGTSHGTSVGGGTSMGNTSSVGNSFSTGTSTSFGESSSTSVSQSFGNSISSGSSQSTGTSESSGNSSSESTGNGTSNGSSSGTSNGNSNSNSSGNSSSNGTSNGNSSSEGSSAGSSNSNSNSSGISSSLSQSQSMSSSHSFGQTSSTSESFGQSLGHSYGTSESWSEGISHSKGESYGNTVSDTLGQSQGVGQSTGTSISEGQSASKGTSISAGKSTGNSLSVSTGQGLGKSTSDSIGLSEGTSTSQGISSGKSKGTSTGESNSLGLSTGFSNTQSTGSSSSMALGPSISYTKSAQWYDENKANLVAILDEQRNRLMSAIRQGAFYVDIYILTPDEKAKKAASVLSTSSFYGDVFPSPVQVVEPDPIWSEHLMSHVSVFSACTAAEDDVEIMEGYKFSTILLPEEVSAYCHPPRFEGGDMNTVYEAIPFFHLPGKMDGPAFIGWCVSTETGKPTEIQYRFNRKNMMHTLITGASGSGKTTTSLRFLSELINNMHFGATVLDWKDDWRSLAYVVPKDKFKFYSLGTTPVNRLHFNPLAVPKGVDMDLWVDTVVESFVIGFGLGQRGYEIIWRNLAKLYSKHGVWKNPERSKVLTLMDLFAEIQGEIDHKGSQKQAGFGDVEAYNRVLSRMGFFTNTDSRLYTMFGNPTNPVPIEDLCEPGTVTVLEAQGMKGPQKSFLLGLIAAGIFQVARSQKPFIEQPHMIVFEEAHEVVKGTDTAGGDSGSGVTEESVYEVMWNEGRSAGLYLVALAQMPTHLPTSVLANTRVYITHQLGADEDIDFISRRMLRDPKIEHKNFPRFLEKVPLGQAIIQTRLAIKHADVEPVLVQVEMIEAPRPTDDQLRLLMLQSQGFLLE